MVLLECALECVLTFTLTLAREFVLAATAVVLGALVLPYGCVMPMDREVDDGDAWCTLPPLMLGMDVFIFMLIFMDAVEDLAADADADAIVLGVFLLLL